MSNVPSIVFSNTGITVPTEAEVLAGVIADFQAAFGSDLNPSLETPQGQLASSLAAIISDKNAQIAYLVNQLDPDYAENRFQDAIGNIYFMERIASSGTVVQADCTGLEGTVIPLGALAMDSSGNIYECTTGVTIDASGTSTATFTCQTQGPIACPSGSLNTIYEAISGWESITNPTAGTEGRDTETRTEFELRRRNTVAANSVGPVAAVKAAVLEVSGVLDVYAVDNKTSSPATIGGVSVAANSIYVAAVGGDQNAIAAAILSKASAGCGFTGNTSVTVYDQTYPDPKPSYAVNFTVPTNVPLFFAVSIRSDANLPTNIDTLIKNAMIAAAAGQDGGTPLKTGYSVYASRFNAGVAGADANVQVVSIKIGIAASPSADYVDFNIDEYPTLDAANITVTQV